MLAKLCRNCSCYQGVWSWKRDVNEPCAQSIDITPLTRMPVIRVRAMFQLKQALCTGSPWLDVILHLRDCEEKPHWNIWQEKLFENIPTVHYMLIDQHSWYRHHLRKSQAKNYPLWYRWRSSWLCWLRWRLLLTSMMAQVEAGLPVLSERVPAMMPPMMPPTSKMVDNIAASSASTWIFIQLSNRAFATEPCPWYVYSWEASTGRCRRPAWQRTSWKNGLFRSGFTTFHFTWGRTPQLQV